MIQQLIILYSVISYFIIWGVLIELEDGYDMSKSIKLVMFLCAPLVLFVLIGVAIGKIINK